MATAEAPQLDNAEIRKRVMRAGYTLQKIIDQLAPPGLDDDIEVLFVGRFSGHARANIHGDTEDGLHTLHVKPDGGSYVTEGA